MFTGLIIVACIACVLLILLVLAQNPKGGINSQFGGSASNVLGVKNTMDFLEKATWGLAALVITISLFASFTISSSSDELIGDPNRQQPGAAGAPDVNLLDPNAGVNALEDMEDQ